MWTMFLALGCGSAPTERATPTPAPAAADAAAAPAPHGARSDADVEALSAALSQGAKLLDVRTPEEFAQGHVPGAVNVPLGSFRASPSDPALAGLDPSKPTYVICAAGGRSSRAADELAAGGFAAVNVTGGTNAWVAAGKPVER